MSRFSSVDQAAADDRRCRNISPQPLARSIQRRERLYTSPKSASCLLPAWALCPLAVSVLIHAYNGRASFTDLIFMKSLSCESLCPMFVRHVACRYLPSDTCVCLSK